MEGEKEMLERLEKQKRYEDQELTGKTLPTFGVGRYPEGLPNTLFGTYMVVEFWSCYPWVTPTRCPVSHHAVSLMEALSAEKGGFYT